MTTLEAVSIDRILAPGQHSGRRVEDLGPRQLAQVMVAIQGMRRDKIYDIEDLSKRVAGATRQATEIRAREFLTCTGPAQQRDQASRLAAAEANFKADCLRAELDAAKDSLRLLKDDWDTCRSVGASQRAEKNAIEGYGS